MRVFADGQNREWTLTMNVAAVTRVRAACDCDLYTLFDDDARGLSALLQDPPALCTVVFHLARDREGKPPFSEEEFAEAIDGDTLDRLADAFTEELIDFFPPRTRELRRKLMAKGQEMVSLATTQAVTELDQTDPAKMLAKLLSLSPGNGSSGNSPAASGSIPANGHSGNSPSPPSPATAASGSA